VADQEISGNGVREETFPSSVSSERTRAFEGLRDGTIKEAPIIRQREDQSSPVIEKTPTRTRRIPHVHMGR